MHVMPVLARDIITQGCWCVRVGLDLMILCLSYNRGGGVWGWSVCPGDAEEVYLPHTQSSVSATGD